MAIEDFNDKPLPPVQPVKITMVPADEVIFMNTPKYKTPPLVEYMLELYECIKSVEENNTDY